MTIQDAQQYFQERLVRVELDATTSAQLKPSTAHFLRSVGLPLSTELGYSFTGITTLLPSGVVRFESAQAGRALCLDLLQDECIRWEDDAAGGFINTSAEQFLQCTYEFERYLLDIQGKEVFGAFYDPSGTFGKRADYANYLQKKFEEIDPFIFSRGYYWAAFIEEIEQGL